MVVRIESLQAQGLRLFEILHVGLTQPC